MSTRISKELLLVGFRVTAGTCFDRYNHLVQGYA